MRSFIARARAHLGAMLLPILAAVLIVAGLLAIAWGLHLWPGTRRVGGLTASPAVTIQPVAIATRPGSTTAPAVVRSASARPRVTTVPPSPTAPPASSTPLPTATPPPTRIPERLVPTASATDGRRPTAGNGLSPTPTRPQATVLPLLSPLPASEATAGTEGGPDRRRIGIVASLADLARYDVAPLGAGWYVTGELSGAPPLPGADYASIIHTSGSSAATAPEQLAEMAPARPGALWLIGNEPDVIWQDNATPDQYAQAYHGAYEALKAADPACQVAVGPISQVTPLRLRYLDAILAAYQQRYGEPMPVDTWNIHVAILREERGSWGVDIPPGMPDDRGTLYEIEDNADVEILKSEVLAFRQWMADRGLRDRPLIITELSVLMPAEYGFPVEKVGRFMRQAFDFMLTATDTQIGYAADGNRLVQRMAWYSAADPIYRTGSLFDPDTGKMTALGQVFAEYMAGR